VSGSRGVKGFGPKAETNILEGLAAVEAGDVAEERSVLSRALAVAEPLLAALRDNPAADRVELAGSARRWTDSVKDLDLIATAHDPEHWRTPPPRCPRSPPPPAWARPVRA
jgi:DNA polymerase (family 10)